MDVQTEATTVVTRTFTVRLTEDELTAALVDARPLQRELRRARNADKRTSNWATTGYAGHAPRTKRAKPHKTSKAKPTAKSGGKVQCVCGGWYSPQGLGPHHRNCPPWQLKQVADKARAAA